MDDDQARLQAAIRDLAATAGVTDLILLYIADGQEIVEVHTDMSTACYLKHSLSDEISATRATLQLQPTATRMGSAN